MKRKISLLILSCLLTTSIGTTAIGTVSHAETQIKSGDVLYLSPNSDGSYAQVNNLDKKSLDTNPKLLKVEAVDSEVYKDKTNNKTLIRANGNKYEEVKEIKIDPSDKKALEEKITKYNINTELSKSLRDYVDKVNNKEISNPGEITYYTPLINTSNSSLSGATTLAAGSTYQGYGGKTYYDELVQYQQTSDPGEVFNSTNWSAYFGSSISETANFIFGGVADGETAGAWSIANIFATVLNANTYPSNANFRHMAYIIETKYVKTTSVVVWDSSTNRYQYYVGARGETSNHYFGNYVVVPGYPNSATTYTSSEYVNTPNYLNLDSKAYYYYLGSPYSEWFTTFKYKYANFTSVE